MDVQSRAAGVQEYREKVMQLATALDGALRELERALCEQSGSSSLDPAVHAEVVAQLRSLLEGKAERLYEWLQAVYGSPEPPHTSASQVDILLVEDNLADEKFLRQFCLQTMQVQPRWITVHDGEEALAFLEQQGVYEGAPRPHVVILDIGLPKRNGWEVLAVMRATPALSSIPVIILAGFLSKEDEARRAQLRPALYFQKPATIKGYKHVAKHVAKSLEHLIRQNNSSV